MNNLVLVTDKNGTPRDWCTGETAVAFYARDKILWETGSEIKIFRGGWNDQGERSSVTISSIIGVSGPVLGEDFFKRQSTYVERDILYARDRNLCAYCGAIFSHGNLTIDHVHPKSRGGKNTWTNCVSACKRCNHHKGNKTPEEAKMELLYVPYAPNVFERLYLSNRKIISCQMDYLLTRIPKTSRCWQDAA